MRTERNKISVTNNMNDKMELELAWDSDIETYLDSFKAILKWMSFSDELVSKIQIQNET